MNWRLLAILPLLAAAYPASAQITLNDDSDQSDEETGTDDGDRSNQNAYRALRDQEDTSPGSVAESAVGRAGQRQTKEGTADNVHPMERLDSRIQNRVQNRIRNRIDRYYDPQANANAPFATAEEQQRKPGENEL